MTIIESKELSKVLKEYLPSARTFVSDSNYACPSIDWLTGSFYTNLFLPWLKQNNLNVWRTDFDCDNFAYMYFTFCQICHAKSSQFNKTDVQGIAVGVMYYITGNDGNGNAGGHAVNFAINSKKELVVIEPQTGKIKKLDMGALGTCWFAVC